MVMRAPCSELEVGVRVWGADMCQRLAICDGAANAGRSYFEGAFVPQGNWRNCTDSELAMLVMSQLPTRPARGSTIQLVRVLSQYAVEREWAEEPESPFLARHQELVDACWALHDSRSPCSVLGYYVNRPGLATVSRDASNGKFVGLHIDSWDRAPMHSRAASRNRICINLGRENRYFLFVNMSIGRCAELAGDSQCPDWNYIVKEFFRKCGGYPIIRLLVAPGEAYIAPTENIIHDGSSLGMVGMDATFTLLGTFWESNLPAC